MARVLLDTTAYIDLERLPRQLHQSWALNTMHHAAAYAAQHGKACLSTVTAMELARGFEQELSPEKLEVFHKDIAPNFEIVGFDLEAAYVAGEIYAKLERTGQRIGIPDTCVTAIALREGLTLVTSNTDHFERIIGLGYSLPLQNWRVP